MLHLRKSTGNHGNTSSTSALQSAVHFASMKDLPRMFALLVACIAICASAATVSLLTAPATGNILIISTNGTGANSSTLLGEFSAVGFGPAVQSVSLTGCVLATSDFASYATLTADGAYALVPCGVISSATRVVVRISSAGVADSSTTYTTGGTYYYSPAGVCGYVF